MKKLNACFSLLLLAMSTALFAKEKTLTAAEIRELLAGNTAVGRWIDHNYRQFFNTDGSTIYAQENTRSSVGRWRINQENNQYESWWERAGWGSGYRILQRDGIYYWISSGDTAPQAFEMLPGQQLTAK